MIRWAGRSCTRRNCAGVRRRPHASVWPAPTALTAAGSASENRRRKQAGIRPARAEAHLMAPMSHEPENLFVDVDTGIDDAFALLYACAETEARLVGVSTVVGNVSLANATRNTRAVLALVGRSDVPVSPGAAFPLAPEPNDARAVHGATGLGHANLPEPPEPADLRPCRRRDRRRGRRPCRTARSRRHRAAHQHRARGDARARAAAPRQALRHHGRGLRGSRQRDAERGVQHLARPGGGADRVPRLRRTGRRAGRGDRPRRDPQGHDRRGRPRGARRPLRGERRAPRP